MQTDAEVAAKLTKAQRWFVSVLSASWVTAGEVGATPNHTRWRDPSLVEASGRGEYRLTDLGLRVAQHLKQENAK